MNNAWKTARDLLIVLLGCTLFALGFDLFLEPGGMNAGGLTGLAAVLTHVLQFGTVGTITTLVNLPLFIIAGIKVGKRFFFGSLIGMLILSGMIDLLSFLPHPDVEPLMAAVYGGVLCGAGLGAVFAVGASTGGSDIIVRLLKLKWKNVPIGTINIFFDFVVAALSGIVLQDISKALYSGVAIFITGKVVDAVVYRFDYSKVALIITNDYEIVAQRIGERLQRGATFLHGEGSYSREDKKVILTAVKRQQLAELKALVADIDPNAFIIVQEAHQVLGDGFKKYTKDSL